MCSLRMRIYLLALLCSRVWGDSCNPTAYSQVSGRLKYCKSTTSGAFTDGRMIGNSCMSGTDTCGCDKYNERTESGAKRCDCGSSALQQPVCFKDAPTDCTVCEVGFGASPFCGCTGASCVDTGCTVPCVSGVTFNNIWTTLACRPCAATCALGNYLSAACVPGADTACTSPCHPGNYCAGGLSQIACPEGTSCIDSGMTAPVPCPLRTYCTGQANPPVIFMTSPADSYLPEFSNVWKICDKCDTGSCTDFTVYCSPGHFFNHTKYAVDLNQMICDRCPPGTYMPVDRFAASLNNLDIAYTVGGMHPMRAREVEALTRHHRRARRAPQARIQLRKGPRAAQHAWQGRTNQA